MTITMNMSSYEIERVAGDEHDVEAKRVGCALQLLQHGNTPALRKDSSESIAAVMAHVDIEAFLQKMSK